MDKFKVSTDCGDDWPLADFGVDSSGQHWWLTTNRVRASELHTVSNGPRADAELVARLLNEHQAEVAQ